MAKGVVCHGYYLHPAGVEERGLPQSVGLGVRFGLGLSSGQSVWGQGSVNMYGSG